MELMRWNPWRELEDVTHRLNTMFRPRSEIATTSRMLASDWNPAVDIKEDNEGYIITAELPGVDKNDLKVSLRNNILAIEGTKKSESKRETETVHRVERFYGNFFRSFALPEGTNEDKILASFNEGILTVHVPKTQGTKVEAKEVPIR